MNLGQPLIISVDVNQTRAYSLSQHHEYLQPTLYTQTRPYQTIHHYFIQTLKKNYNTQVYASTDNHSFSIHQWIPLQQAQQSGRNYMPARNPQTNSTEALLTYEKNAKIEQLYLNHMTDPLQHVKLRIFWNAFHVIFNGNSLGIFTFTLTENCIEFLMRICRAYRRQNQVDLLENARSCIMQIIGYSSTNHQPAQVNLSAMISSHNSLFRQQRRSLLGIIVRTNNNIEDPIFEAVKDRDYVNFEESENGSTHHTDSFTEWSNMD